MKQIITEWVEDKDGWDVSHLDNRIADALPDGSAHLYKKRFWRRETRIVEAKPMEWQWHRWSSGQKSHLISEYGFESACGIKQKFALNDYNDDMTNPCKRCLRKAPTLNVPKPTTP